jgi:general secretion pathway protein B
MGSGAVEMWAAAPAATGTVFAQADLPEAVRAQLPSLKISGVTYSSNPVYRMAIVNGQVLHEGDPAGPGLLLEKIEPGRTIWSFKGYRYGLASQ